MNGSDRSACCAVIWHMRPSEGFDLACSDEALFQFRYGMGEDRQHDHRGKGEAATFTDRQGTRTLNSWHSRVLASSSVTGFLDGSAPGIR